MSEGYLTEDERRAVLSMARYWHEVNGRDDREQVKTILSLELQAVIYQLGPKLLWILEAYAKEHKDAA